MNFDLWQWPTNFILDNVNINQHAKYLDQTQILPQFTLLNQALELNWTSSKHACFPVELIAVKFANWRSCAVKTPTAMHVFTTPVLHLQCSSRAVIKPLRQRLFTADDKVALKWGEHHTSFCRHCGQQTVRALIRWTPKFCGPPRIAVYQQPIKDVDELRDCTEAVWDSGRTSVSGRRTFPVLRSTCSWWVTTNVGKPSAIGQPTRPTQPFILPG